MGRIPAENGINLEEVEDELVQVGHCVLDGIITADNLVK